MYMNRIDSLECQIAELREQFRVMLYNRDIVDDGIEVETMKEYFEIIEERESEWKI